MLRGISFSAWIGLSDGLHAGHPKVMDQTRISGLTWAAMGALALIWGGSFLSNHVALADVKPVTLVAFRMSGAALALWAVALAGGWVIPRGLKLWGAFAVMGLLNNVIPFSLITWGQQTVPSGLAAILNASTAIFGVVVAAMVFADERLTPTRLAGVLLGFAGVATAIGIENLREFDLTAISQLAILAATVCYALSGAFARVYFKGIRPQVAALAMATMSALMIWPIALLSEGTPTFDYHGTTWAALAYLALMATATAYMLMYWIIPRAGAGNTALITLLVAPVAIVLGAIVLQEKLPANAYVGFALLALGLILLDGRLVRRLSGKP
jgi:drug/metabolite transporter (DMT)-like permease